jgi:hypothetical protein
LAHRGERLGDAAESSFLRVHLGCEAGPLLGSGRLPGCDAPGESVREPLLEVVGGEELVQGGEIARESFPSEMVRALRQMAGRFER